MLQLTDIDEELDLVAKTARLGRRFAVDLKVCGRPHDVTEPRERHGSAPALSSDSYCMEPLSPTVEDLEGAHEWSAVSIAEKR